MLYRLPTAWLLLATVNEVNQIAYNVQEISVSQCTSAFQNFSPLVVDTAASSVARRAGEGELTCRPICIRKKITFLALLRLFYALESTK